jgi:hypothetical protein
MSGPLASWFEASGPCGPPLGEPTEGYLPIWIFLPTG